MKFLTYSLALFSLLAVTTAGDAEPEPIETLTGKEKVAAYKA